MGKRSNFPRRERDFYSTPKEAVIPLLEHLPKQFKFAEPCYGKGDLAFELVFKTGKLWYASELQTHRELGIEYPEDYDHSEGIQWGKDALTLTAKDVEHCDYIITNPPWSRDILHPLIDHLRILKPTWLLIDAPWMFTKQATPYLKLCSDIVTVGRVKWIADSRYTSKDDCCWYKFVDYETETIFHGR